MGKRGVCEQPLQPLDSEDGVRGSSSLVDRGRAAGVQACLLPGAGAPCRLGRLAHSGVRRGLGALGQSRPSPWLLCAVVT